MSDLEHVQDIDLLTPEECTQVRDKIHSLRDAWIERRPDVPFYTLGAASYLDAAKNGFAAYKEQLDRSNPILHEHFGWLHEKVASCMEEVLGEPMGFDHRIGLPGFHIFLAHERFTRPMASLHYDLQFESIDWTGIGTPDHRRHLSMTLTIRLPKDGGGLRVWDINNLEMQDLTLEERKKKVEGKRKPDYHPYAEGKMALHSGHQLHQIAPTKRMVDGDERITLQAHALPVDGKWLGYW